MSVSQFVYRRMMAGAGVLGLYGLWVACLRLPRGLTGTTLVFSWAWALALFAGAGMILAAAAAGLALIGAKAVRPVWRPGAVATIETAVLMPLFLWLVLNEVVYSTTSQVIGHETLLLIWANAGPVFQNAWAMGWHYLVGTAAAVLAASIVCWRASRRSCRKLWPASAEAELEGAGMMPAYGAYPRLAGSMGGLLVLACLLAWQVHTRPSAALTVVCRSAPPLRAFNVARALIGLDLDGPQTFAPGAPLISDVEYQLAMGEPHRPAPNIIMIVLESVSAKALHCYGYPREDITPNMDRLATDGTLFEQCLATGSFSSYGLVSVMTSLYMLRAANNDHFSDTSFPFLGLPRALKLAGYQLALFSSGNEAFDNINHFTPPADFEAYFSLDTADVPKPDCMRLSDHYAVERFESWVAARKDSRPFYCGFYLQSTHFNYEVPEPWGSYYKPVPPLYSNGDGIIHIPADKLPLLKNAYDNSMRYSDYWVGRIRQALEKAGAFDNSIIVIVGDHGEAFMEHGLARHGVALWDEMVRIPFILHAGPAVKARAGRVLPSRVTGTVSGADVAPTIAALVGIKPHPSWQGVDVLAPGYTSEDRPVFSVLQLTRWQEAVVLNGFKYVYDLGDVQGQLFDLRTDPGEKVDLIDKAPELAAALKDVLGAWHTRQLHYYAPASRPFKQYLGRFELEQRLLDRFRATVEAHTAAHAPAGMVVNPVN